MKILFFGTPKFAEIVLEKLLSSHHQVVGVVCQPDKPKGRGNKMVSPDIVLLAKNHNVPVFQFDKLSAHLEEFQNINCDIGVTASYGKIIPSGVLNLFPIVNVHPSKLPKYRGATPIQSAFLNGDKETAVTIMKTEVGMDDGDIFVQKTVPILEDDDYSTLMPRLAEIGADLLLETLGKIEEGVAVRTPQNHAEATFVKPVKKEDAVLDFSCSAKEVVGKVRAFCENPVAHFFVGEERIRVFKACVADEKSLLQRTDLKTPSCVCVNLDGEALANSVGRILVSKKQFFVQASDGFVQILRCQAAGAKSMDVTSFLNGYHFKADFVD